MLSYKFEYKSTTEERLNVTHGMLGTKLIGDMLSMLFTGCRSVETFDSWCERRYMAPCSDLQRAHSYTWR